MTCKCRTINLLLSVQQSPVRSIECWMHKRTLDPFFGNIHDTFQRVSERIDPPASYECTPSNEIPHETIDEQVAPPFDINKYLKYV